MVLNVNRNSKRGGAIIAVDRRIAAIELDIHDETLVLIDRVRADRNHLVGGQVATGKAGEPVLPPVGRGADRNLVARLKEAWIACRRRRRRRVEQGIGVVCGIEIAAREAEPGHADRRRGVRHFGIEGLVVEPRPIRHVEPGGRGKVDMPDDIGDLVMQAGIFRKYAVLGGAVGLADEAVEGGAAKIPGAVQRRIQADAAVQAVDAGKAVEAEQVHVGEFEVQAVLVRIFVVLAVADLRCDHELQHAARSSGCPRHPNRA